MKKEFFEMAGISREEFSSLSAQSRRKAKNYYYLFSFSREQADKQSEEYYMRCLRLLGASAIVEREFI